MGKFSILKEFFTFLKSRGKWWLIVVAVFLLLLGSLLVLSHSSALAPFIYTIF